MKRFNILVLATLLMTCSTASFGEDENGESFQRGEGMKRGEGGGMIAQLIKPRMAEKLGLTDEQKSDLEMMAEEFKTKRKVLQEQMEGTMNYQAELLLTSEPVDEAAVMSAIDKAFDVRRDMAKLQMKTLLAAKNILTTEQLKILQAQRDEFKKNHRDEWKRNRSERQKPVTETETTSDVSAGSNQAGE